VHTYANTINTHEGGTHEEGFRAALTTLINRYAREKGILKEKDDNLSGDDFFLNEVDGGLKWVVHQKVQPKLYLAVFICTNRRMLKIMAVKTTVLWE
jgi:DNA gyrase/topoisomerase IV subunit B